MVEERLRQEGELSLGWGSHRPEDRKAGWGWKRSPGDREEEAGERI